MKIVILNTSDSKGGAAIVSLRLMRALCAAGMDARMLVVDRRTDDERVAVAGTPEQLKWAFLRERLDIFVRNGLLRSELFKVSIANKGVDVLSHPWVKNADIVCINWINQGMMSLASLEALGKMGKKLVWTMHDMWCLTGMCHHSYGCDHYRESCGKCRFVRFPHSHDLSYRTWKKKQRLYSRADFHFVAVSSWLSDRFRESSLTAGKPLTVIPNALPAERFAYDRSTNIPVGKKVIAMGAARLDDPVKGFELMAEAVNHIATQHPEKAKNLQLLLFGDIRNPELLTQLKLPYEWIGPVSLERIPELYRRSDIVLSSSHFETLPTTLIEGQAAGCLAVAFDHGGQRDIINHRKNGYLAKYADTADLAEGLLWAAEQTADRAALHYSVVERFSEARIAEMYIRLFEQL